VIKIDLKQEWIDWAKEVAEDTEQISDNSHMKNERRDIGFLGEYIVEQWFEKGRMKYVDGYDYDFILDDEITVDVKSKGVKSIPKGHHEASVSKYYRQKCDMYIFVRINLKIKKAWIVGWSSNEDFHNEAEYGRKGSVRGSNKMKVRQDSYFLPIKKLEPIEELV
jgi:hypothetical protein